MRDNPHAPPVVLTAVSKLGDPVRFGRAAWAVEEGSLVLRIPLA